MAQQELTKQERKQLKKQQQQAVRQRAKRNKTIARWTKIGLAVLVVLAGIYGVFLHRPDTAGKGVLRLAAAEHDFGLASTFRGKISTKIPIVNIGDGPLTITGLESSCGCTSARIVNNSIEGPLFGMAGHGSNPKNWSTIIGPGEQAVLHVYYDPSVHPDLRGPVTRIVTIYSDDPLTPKQEFKIKVNQVG